ncbi:hypothetical protein DPMN_170286 [Dreissena polymorpha]|uniref:CRAL-TRIO domain-containing protein n=1 Tax=Dreissena polymorpha TaxID=45954 RepID=A0A9D4ID16_DREPO|nr:hypothetical protein DPMN_170286 [Dreissena polymorpha]
MIRPMMSDKLKQRVHVHGQSLTSVYEKIEMSLLPEDYLPEDETPNAGYIEDICKNIAKDMAKPEVRAFIKDLHSGQYGVDLSLKPHDDEPQASFRKLNVS